MGLTDDIPIGLARVVKGALAAALGGAGFILGSAWANPNDICFTSECLQILSKQMLSGATIAVVAYFTKPPRNPNSTDRRMDRY